MLLAPCHMRSGKTTSPLSKKAGSYTSCTTLQIAAWYFGLCLTLVCRCFFFVNSSLVFSPFLLPKYQASPSPVILCLRQNCIIDHRLLNDRSIDCFFSLRQLPTPETSSSPLICPTLPPFLRAHNSNQVRFHYGERGEGAEARARLRCVVGPKAQWVVCYCHRRYFCCLFSC